MRLTKKEIKNQLIEAFNKTEIDADGIAINKFKIIDNKCYIGKITIMMGDLDSTCYEIKDVVSKYCEENDIEFDGIIIDC
jgi:nucleoside 2-deoxyribosyltransferase